MKNWKQKISFIGLFLILFCTVLAVKTEHVQAASGYQLYSSQIGCSVRSVGWLEMGKEVGNDWQVLHSKKIKWYSTNKKIAKITYKSYGCNYETVRPGTCYICAKFKGKTYKCKFVVYNARKSNVKKLKIGMKGCINNSEYYSYGCRIYNPNDFAVETKLYAKVKTKRGARIANNEYDIEIPAKGYKYIAGHDESGKLKGTSVKVTYRFSPKKPTPISINYYQSLAIPAKKTMKVTKLSIKKRSTEDEYDKNYYVIKYKFKNISKELISSSTTEIFLIKNKKVIGSFHNDNSSNIDPGETVLETEPYGNYWPFKRWKRVVVVNSYD